MNLVRRIANIEKGINATIEKRFDALEKKLGIVGKVAEDVIDTAKEIVGEIVDTGNDVVDELKEGAANIKDALDGDKKDPKKAATKK